MHHDVAMTSRALATNDVADDVILHKHYSHCTHTHVTYYIAVQASLHIINTTSPGTNLRVDKLGIGGPIGASTAGTASTYFIKKVVRKVYDLCE